MNKPDQPEQSYKWRNLRHQYYATVTACIVMLGHGCTAGWVSPALPILESDDTPLDSGKINPSDASWIGSLDCIGAFFGTAFYAGLITIIGNKQSMLLIAIPSAMHWILIYFGNNPYHLYAARFVTGWAGGGIQTAIVLYISEIANDDIRGKLCSFVQMSRYVGNLLAYIIGSYVAYIYVPVIFVFIPTIFAIIFMFLPNTPQYYLRKNQIKNAENALKYYKGFRGNCQYEAIAFQAEFDRMQATSKQRKRQMKFNFSDFCTKNSIRGLTIGIALAIFSAFTGLSVFITYAVTIFQATHTDMNAYLCSIILGIMQILGCLCSTQLSDTLGRKIMLIVSFMGTTIGISILVIFLYMQHSAYDVAAFSWIPVTMLSFVIFVLSAGINPLLGVCTVENLPSKIRTIGLSISAFIMDVALFLTLKLFPLLLPEIQLHGCLLVFAVSCIIATFFVTFVMRETKATSMEANDDDKDISDTQQQSC